MTPPPTLLAPVVRTTPGADDLRGCAPAGLVLIVAPCNGRFMPVVDHGRVAQGDVVARVTTRDSAQDVPTPVTARIRGLLTLPGHLVTRGQALAWGDTERADLA